jgi:hypothetical protein
MRCFKCKAKYGYVPLRKTLSWMKSQPRYKSGLLILISGINGHFKVHSWSKNTSFVNGGGNRF